MGSESSHSFQQLEDSTDPKSRTLLTVPRLRNDGPLFVSTAGYSLGRADQQGGAQVRWHAPGVRRLEPDACQPGVPRHDPPQAGVLSGLPHPIVGQPLWDEVQAAITDNRVDRRASVNLDHYSLPSGLLIDQAGRPISPSHRCRASKRYRYYQTHPQQLGTSGVPAMRLSTGDLGLSSAAPLRIVDASQLQIGHGAGVPGIPALHYGLCVRVRCSATAKPGTTPDESGPAPEAADYRSRAGLFGAPGLNRTTLITRCNLGYKIRGFCYRPTKRPAFLSNIVAMIYAKKVYCVKDTSNFTTL
jgi:hypothetical protein